MSQFSLTLAFALISLAGLGLIWYGLRLRRVANTAEQGKEILGFSDATGEGSGFLDFDTGYEGLKHKEKEVFDPDKHVPEVLESRK